MSYKWPQKGEKAFIAGDYHNNSPVHADINYIRHRLSPEQLAEGFKEAGDKIVKELERGEDIYHPDIYFFPISYLYRHSTELILKEIVRYGLYLNIIDPSVKIDLVLESHNLYKIWNYAKQVLKVFYSNSPQEELGFTENLINQFHELDKNGQAFRYSRDKNGNSTVENMPAVVDLKNLKNKFEGLYNFLSSTLSGLQEGFSNLSRF